MTPIRKRVLILCILICSWFSLSLVFDGTAFVERYYSNGIYPIISGLLRILLGWIPFSVGDILYLVVILYLLIKVGRVIRALCKRKYSWPLFRNHAIKAATILFTALLLFDLVWGYNYRRASISDKLGLKAEKYTVTDLKKLCTLLTDSLNTGHRELTGNDTTGTQNVFNRNNYLDEAIEGYHNIQQQHPSLTYAHKSAKPSLFGTLISYMGTEGYYNPFSGEAQLNTGIPSMNLPFVSCHELSHQLGIAYEDEANLAGYLVAVNHKNKAFHYSARYVAIRYVLGELRVKDSVAFKTAITQLSPGVIKDFKQEKLFWRNHENPFSVVFSIFFDKFLKLNRQESGINSYQRITTWLIAYHKIKK